MDCLSVQEITKSFQSRQVVNHVSLSINSGEIVGILGPNGAGKTSCFYMMLGLIHPDSGKITLNDQNITQLPIHTRAELGIGYLPQEASVFRKLSVSDNLLAILETRQDLNAEDRLSRLEELLYEFRIAHLRNFSGYSLSGGERRRVEIARALARNPKFILLDEPFSGVDPISIVEIKNIAYQLSQQGIGILITDHNVRDTLDICQRAYIIDQGTVIAEGTPSTILNDPKVREVYLGEEFKL